MSPGAGGVRACLVDVYSTLLRYDFAHHSRRLAELAGADVPTWQRAQIALNAAFDSGRLSGPELLTCLLECCGMSPRPGQIAELERASREYLRDSAGAIAAASQGTQRRHRRARAAYARCPSRTL